jgi:glucose/arabinose dehydrogenase
MSPSNPVRIAAISLCVLLALALSACSASRASQTAPAASSGQAAHPASPAPEPAATAKSATPTPSPDAAGAAVGTPVVPSGKQKPQVGKIARPSDDKAIEEAKKLLRANEDAKVRSATVTAMTQDSRGRWWVLLAVDDADSGAVQAVLVFDGKKWDDVVYAVTVQTTDLPPDVTF